MTREEHLDWCKKRALEYADKGDLASAVASLLSDLKKHGETDNINPVLEVMGLYAASSGNAYEVRRFINGFN